MFNVKNSRIEKKAGIKVMVTAVNILFQFMGSLFYDAKNCCGSVLYPCLNIRRVLYLQIDFPIT